VPAAQVAAFTSGNMNAQPVLQAAALGGQGWLPCGTYRLDGSLIGTSAAPFGLEGPAEGCVTLNVNFTAGDVVQLTQVQRPFLRHITINAAVTRTSGAIIHATGTYGANFDGLAFTGPHGGDGYLLDGGANTTSIQSWDCRPPVAFVIGEFGAGACIHATGGFVDLFLGGAHGNCASWHYCLEITNGSGLYAMPFDSVLAGNALIFDPSAAAGQTVFGVMLTSPYLDTSAGDNALIAGDGAVSNVKLGGAWFSNSQTANGLAVTNAAVNGLQVDLADSLANFGHGVVLLAGSGITLTNVHAQMNSAQGAGLADGFYIGPLAQDVTLIAPRAGAGGVMQTIRHHTNNQRWGINAPGGSTAGQRITVIGAQTLGNLTGGVNLPVNTAPNTITSLGNVGN